MYLLQRSEAELAGLLLLSRSFMAGSARKKVYIAPWIYTMMYMSVGP